MFTLTAKRGRNRDHLVVNHGSWRHTHHLFIVLVIIHHIRRHHGVRFEHFARSLIQLLDSHVLLMIPIGLSAATQIVNRTSIASSIVQSLLVGPSTVKPHTYALTECNQGSFHHYISVTRRMTGAMAALRCLHRSVSLLLTEEGPIAARVTCGCGAIGARHGGSDLGQSFLHA